MTRAEFRQHRRALGLTQSALTRIMGYGAQPAISYIETAATDVPAQAARLMKGLHNALIINDEHVGMFMPFDLDLR